MSGSQINQDSALQEEANKAVWAAFDTFHGFISPDIYKARETADKHS